MSTTKTEGEEDAVLLHFLGKLGLDGYYPNKLKLQSLIEINKYSIDEQAVLSVDEIPCFFLRKLFKVNAGCRSSVQSSVKAEQHDEDTDLFAEDLYTDVDPDAVNPLDLIAALFLCADSFLQQEMALKMSMCQFSLPLLLPYGHKSQCTLMLWALRDIVKEWCPHEMSDTKGFVENNIVQANIPFFSFVRLKNSELSKSQFLNHILSSGQQNCNIFIHRDVEGGAIKREIANGLVEVCWYLPSGKTLDVFPEPVAFANLRGNISDSLTQFNFLFQVSTATFVFLDSVEENEQRILSSLQGVKSKIILVVNRKGGNAGQEMMSVRRLVDELDLPRNRVKVKDQKVNVAEFSRNLCEVIKKSLTDVTSTMSIANMVEKAVELGLSVDESKTDAQKKAAEDIMEEIGVRSIHHYKKQELPLQGPKWKRLSQLEKEQCRLKKSDDYGLEEYKSGLQEEKVHIRLEQRKCKVSKGMEKFIECLSTSDKEKRDIFLKWMKLKFNTFSRDKLSALRNQFKEHCMRKDIKLIAELDQALVESSLGIEHYMREVGLIYEFSTITSTTATNAMSHLPGMAADMLLDGYPLELLDGDASNVPQRWVKEVLMELHKKVGRSSRLLVLTVLGVQSSGKSTLLNTMFGVQFPVSSGRCTRGAFMLFLKIGDLKTELNCDFIVLIDTEGLKSPDLAQLEDSYEHDNQLATFVIGLSDVTIINVAMENANEMKDVLQIAVHAFLRMKEVGKKPICHFIHQNVSAVSAHAKTMTERKHLLDQLNEMTQIAAEMEKKQSVKEFTDVLDYDMEKNNWNIPGLWHGTPPMAPVNTGYSEAVAHFKRNLLQTLKNDRCNDLYQIPEFLQWMECLWKAVKYENFIFSFRNTLVAHAYDNLCKEFNQWEWELRREILTWLTTTEVEILNADNESAVETWNRFVGNKKSQVSLVIKDERTAITQKLCDYYKMTGKRVNLIEKYKADFLNRISSIANEIQHLAWAKLDCILELKINSKKAQDIQREYRGMIEEKVMKLLGDCNEATKTEEELSEEFEKMWAEATVNVSDVKEQDIATCVLRELRNNFANLKVNEDLQRIRDLQNTGKEPFQTSVSHIDTLGGKIQHLWTGNLQSFANTVIYQCERFIHGKMTTNGDYHDSFTRDLLQHIDSYLKKGYTHHKTNTQFEIDVKLHICGIASRKFAEMHRKFLADNNPRTKLEKYKTQYLTDFLDLYKNKDHCQRKATDFVQSCIKPAVKQYISRSLGVDIVDEILTSSHSAEYGSRTVFQYNIQKELLLKEDFGSFLKYIENYEMYVKDWIFHHILQRMSVNKTLCKLENNNLNVIIKKVLDAIDWSTKGKDGTLLPDNKESIQELISNMRKYLIKDISVSVEAERTTLFQIQSPCHSFINCLKISIQELKEQLEEELSNCDINKTLNKLQIKPQDELFKRVFGCGKQCPFCGTPCEAGGAEHMQHHAAVHRPQGFGRFKDSESKKLINSLCTTDVHSDRVFKNQDTNWEWHPYKDYAKHYPAWIIPPDPTIEASDYWKYVLVQYNKDFAEEYAVKPADVPMAWTRLTNDQALKGLKDAFNMK